MQVMRELRCTYKTVSEGIMNLADKFFEMVRACENMAWSECSPKPFGSSLLDSAWPAVKD